MLTGTPSVDLWPRRHLVSLVAASLIVASCGLFSDYAVEGGEADITMRNETNDEMSVSYDSGREFWTVPARSEVKGHIEWTYASQGVSFAATNRATNARGLAKCDPVSSRDRRLIWDGRELRCVGWTGTSQIVTAAASPTAAPRPATTPTAVAATSDPTVVAATATTGAATPTPPAATARPTTAPATLAPTVAPTAAATPVPTPTLNPVRTVTLVNSGSQNTHLFGPGETFPCCMVVPGSSRTRTYNATTTPTVQFRAGRNGSILPGTTITCTFGAGTAPRVVYTSSGLSCQGW